MSRFLYYIIIKPLSRLPLKWLYGLSYVLYWVIFKLMAYRKKVVFENMTLAYPENSDDQLETLISAFYSHFCDVVVEGIKAFSIKNNELRMRYQFENAQLLDALYDGGRDVIIAAAHYGNWEWATMSSDLAFKHQCVGIYTPLSDKFFEQKMKKSRGRNGLVLLPKSEVKEYFQQKHDKPQLYFFLVDQSPNNVQKSYWTTFLGRKTPVQYGIEKYSTEYNIPVYFLEVKKIKRGNYKTELKEISVNPQKEHYGSIIEKTNRLIESMIQQDPAIWLWTHRRWKHSQTELKKAGNNRL